MKRDDRKKPSKPPSKLSLPRVGDVVVGHTDLPAKMPDDKKIHPRRPLPLVPEAPPKTPEKTE